MSFIWSGQLSVDVEYLNVRETRWNFRSFAVPSMFPSGRFTECTCWKIDASRQHDGRVLDTSAYRRLKIHSLTLLNNVYMHQTYQETIMDASIA